MNSFNGGIPGRYLLSSALIHFLILALFFFVQLREWKKEEIVTVYLSPYPSATNESSEKVPKPTPGLPKGSMKVSNKEGGGIKSKEPEEKEISKGKGSEELAERIDHVSGEKSSSTVSLYEGDGRDYPYGIPVEPSGSGLGHGFSLSGDGKGGHGIGSEGGSVGGKGGEKGSYGYGDGGGTYLKANFSYIRDIILKNLKYPYIARLRGYEGDVVVSFVIDEKGFPQEVKIVSNSGHEILAQNTIETIRAIGRFPEPPTKVRVILPVAYRLK